ncbi:Dabb family protein [Pseudoruegeria sp. SHC-113]|uniref:Dabb family protein n=1 Tax=Pseudoruegeria sp. SHC-113 TaxID=2855439 RepID=UPI0021BA6A18|nr:Dabb family protein [Pseudoruegeria sp. SHC-113]MCT8159472.1 Dabb family protein [Pseudoruegeria sp. SHC-113]
MIAHCVFLDLRADADTNELAEVLAWLDALRGEIDGYDGFEAGPNRDYELKTPQYPWGFICRFRDAAALQVYAQDPGHKALGARLVAMCNGGADGILVFDLES